MTETDASKGTYFIESNRKKINAWHDAGLCNNITSSFYLENNFLHIL